MQCILFTVPAAAMALMFAGFVALDLGVPRARWISVLEPTNDAPQADRNRLETALFAGQRAAVA